MKNIPHDKHQSSMTLTKSARLLLVLIPCIASPLAFAGGQHYQHDPGPPVCTITVTSATSATATCTSAVVAGLGNQDVEVTVLLTASAPVTCYNPGANKTVKGHPATVIGSSSIGIPSDQIRNGSVTIPAMSTTASLNAPDATTACPNGNWTAQLGPVTFGPGRYSFQQPAGTELAKLSFNF